VAEDQDIILMDSNLIAAEITRLEARLITAHAVRVKHDVIRHNKVIDFMHALVIEKDTRDLASRKRSFEHNTPPTTSKVVIQQSLIGNITTTLFGNK
jgi:hypothetical protein